MFDINTETAAPPEWPWYQPGTFPPIEDTDWWKPSSLCGIDELSPTTMVLPGYLTTIDMHQMSGGDAVVVLRAAQRMVSHYQAVMYRAMARIVDAVADGDHESTMLSAEGEIQPALTWTRRRTEHELTLATELQHRIPHVLDALEHGVIDQPKARIFDNLTLSLPVSAARDVCDQVLSDAPHLTTGQLRARLARLVDASNPDAATQRYEQSVEQRRVTLERTIDGTADLGGFDLPADKASMAAHRIATLANQAATADDPRTPDQRRADVFLDLLIGTNTATGPNRNHAGANTGGSVTMHVDLTTLAELDNTPADVAGFGPVIADIARQLAKDHTNGQWRYQITNHTGTTIATGTTRRRPTPTERRTITTTYPTCMFPGCRTPSTASDLDHRINHSETGTTDPNDMIPLCRHHHRTKTITPHTYTINPPTRPGPPTPPTVTWRTPTGHHYTTHPNGTTTKDRDPPSS